MTTTLRSCLVALGLALATTAAPVIVAPAFAQSPPGESVDTEVFYRELDQHGHWFSHPQYGYVWSPDVARDWRPYTVGQWVFTEEHGWYWQSDEPFGWAVFHYGRWFLDDDSGWVWVPGTEWAPAWVAWRHSEQQVGWAPLPPEAEWRGDSLSFSERYYESPRYVAAWCFVPVALLTARRLYRHVTPINRNHLHVRQTNWVPSHRFVDRRIYNSGFDRGRYERITRRPLVSVQIVNAARPGDYGRRGNNRDVVQAYRPQFRAVAPSIAPPRVIDHPRRDFGGGRPGFTRPGDLPPNRGWNRPGDPAPGRQVSPPVQQPATIPPPQPPQVRITPPQQPATIPPPVTSQPPGQPPVQRRLPPQERNIQASPPAPPAIRQVTPPPPVQPPPVFNRPPATTPPPVRQVTPPPPVLPPAVRQVTPPPPVLPPPVVNRSPPSQPQVINRPPQQQPGTGASPPPAGRQGGPGGPGAQSGGQGPPRGGSGPATQQGQGQAPGKGQGQKDGQRKRTPQDPPEPQPK